MLTVLLAALRPAPPRRIVPVLFLGDSCTLSELRQAATGAPDGAARHLATGRFVSRRAAETLTATEATWFRPSAGGAQ